MNTKLLALALFTCAMLGCGGTQRPDGQRGMLAAQDEAPHLATTDHRGQAVDLHDGTVSLVYFYPKDNTPGCTREACAFRDVFQRFEEAGIRVVGVSSDSNDAHRAFAEEHALPFALIADEANTWSDAFGVQRVLGMNARVSFLIDAQGKIAKVYPEVDPGLHADQVLSDAAALGLTHAP